MTNDELVINGLVEAFVVGWNTQDGAACARPFAEDADFTAVTGLKARGRDLIGRGYSEILSTVFRGTTIVGEVESIRFLRGDVAVVDVTFKVRAADGKEAFGVQHSSAGLVVTKEGEVWSIAVFRNMVPFMRPPAGPLERELLGAAHRS